MQLTVPVLCGSPHVKLLFHLHMLAHLSLGFPTGEALTGRMPSTDQHYVSKYTPDFTFHSSFFFFPPVQVLWMEQLH